MKFSFKTMVCLVSSFACVHLVGCQGVWNTFHVDRCASIPKGAIPAPPGVHVNKWQRAQVASASADLGVFYDNQFIPKSAELSPSGQEHVARLVQQSLTNSIPVIVEPSPSASQNDARLLAVQRAFANHGVELGSEQLYIAKPAARGLDGFRAQQVMRSSMGNGGGSGGGMGGGGQSGVGGGTGSGGAGFGGGGMF